MVTRSRSRRPTLTGYLFLANCALLVSTLFAAGALWTVHDQHAVRQDYEQRAMTMAESVAALPSVREKLRTGDPGGDLQSLAETLRRASGFRYVVIVDRNGLRRSHPNPDAIGKRPWTDPAPVLAGNTWTGVERGPAGLTLRARVPVRDTNSGHVLGYVSVGVLSTKFGFVNATALPTIIGTILLVLVAGACGALLISRRIRTKTRGLEPSEITELVEGREALLHAIGEGVLAVDRQQRVLLANDSAREMLALPERCTGRTPEGLGVPERLRTILRGQDSPDDVFIAVGDRLLVCHHRPVLTNGTVTGVLVTLREHTELARLGGELDGVRTMANGLRAQSHEFANRIHTVSGMLELGATQRAREYLAELSASTTRASARVSERIADVALAALVLAKSAQAAERGVEFELAALTDVPAELPAAQRDDVLLVVGNLLDNALDAVSGAGFVELLVREHQPSWTDRLLEVRVTDTGGGVDDVEHADIFTAGVSTKDADGQAHQGLGLALVRQAVLRWQGSIDIDTSEETVFTAYFRLRERE